VHHGKDGDGDIPPFYRLDGLPLHRTGYNTEPGCESPACRKPRQRLWSSCRRTTPPGHSA
jgi:hypothetical protein